MLIAGIDEAGRGPCVGPLVMAVTCIEKKQEQSLLELGVRDSKLLQKKKREEFFPKIKKIVKEYSFSKISASKIDTLRIRKSLNEIEAMMAGELLNSLKKKPDLVYVDSPDILEANFALRIKKYISFDIIIKAEHKADINYPVVSAASILAKVMRDNEIEKLEKKYGKIGSGYSHDETTITFLKNYLHDNNSLPNIVRKSWVTTQNILKEKYQKKIANW